VDLNGGTAVILDEFGHPITPAATTEPGLTGGWVLSGGLGRGGTVPETTGLYGVDRRTERRKSRIAYYLNPVYWAALQVTQGYVIGDAFSWGDHSDRRVREVVDDLGGLNHLPDLAERFWTEFMLDGENATVWTGTLTRDAPARLAFLDVDRGVDLTHTVQTGITRLEADRETWAAGEFVWSAWDALYNDPRGWPVARHAVDPCVAYVNLLNARLRQQDLQGRINAVYKALIYGRSSEARLAEQKAKAAAYGRVPRDGAVVTLAMDPETGRSEELQFLDPGRGASDAASDARLLRLVVASVIGVPEHYLGEGGNVTRTTADAMGDPARRALLRRQAVVRSWLDRVVRAELVRRDGIGRKYRTQVVEYADDGRTRKVSTKMVPASRVEVPWVFPDLTSDDTMSVAKLVEMAVGKRIMSMQTARARLGLDPAVENERLELERGNGDAPPAPQPPAFGRPNRDDDEDKDDGDERD
jgi:hypothetical protein